MMKLRIYQEGLVLSKIMTTIYKLHFLHIPALSDDDPGMTSKGGILELARSSINLAKHEGVHTPLLGWQGVS